MALIVLWVSVLALLFLVWAVLSYGSYTDDIMLGDEQYKETKSKKGDE